MQSEWIAERLGHLTGLVSTGFQETHRRFEYQDRTSTEWRRYMLSELRRIDRKRNGNGHGPKIPYAKIATILGLIILGALGHIAPEAVRAAIGKILLSQVGAG